MQHNPLLISMVRLVSIWVERSYFMIFQEEFEQMRSLEQDLTFLSANIILRMLRLNLMNQTSHLKKRT